MPAQTSGLPAEAFGLPLSPGSLPKSLRDRLEQRHRDRLCPFLMKACPRPYPICSIYEGGEAHAICPHRLLQGQTVFRSLAPQLLGRRPTLLPQVDPGKGAEVLGWVLFDAHHPDLWIGVNLMTPLPSSAMALAHATHDLFHRGALQEQGYELGFDWPATLAEGSRWLAHLARWAQAWQRPVDSFTPKPLFDRLQSLFELRGVRPSPVSLVSVILEREASGFQLRVPVPPVHAAAPPERGEMWRAILRRWSDWISLDILGGMTVVESKGPPRA